MGRLLYKSRKPFLGDQDDPLDSHCEISKQLHVISGSHVNQQPSHLSIMSTHVAQGSIARYGFT